MVELLSPAGDYQKGKIAFNYGADAIYFAGPRWGLREAAKNFTLYQIERVVKLAKTMGKRCYVTINMFPIDTDYASLKNYLIFLKEIDIDAVIVSDFGVLDFIKQNQFNIPIHVSTQASVLNYRSAKFWKKNGVERVVVARELNIEEIKNIKDKANIDVEVFIHGAMCISFSGKCILSNITSSRDANRGGCSQSCRWGYKVENGDKFYHPLNSKDLNSSLFIEKMISSNIDSFKIEGRMKSLYYIAKTVSVYRHIIDSILGKKSPNIDIVNSLNDISHRGYCSGSLNSLAGPESIRTETTQYEGNNRFIGVIETVKGNKHYISVKNRVNKDEKVYALLKDGTEILIDRGDQKSYDNETMEIWNPNSIVVITLNHSIGENIVLFTKGGK